MEIVVIIESHLCTRDYKVPSHSVVAQGQNGKAVAPYPREIPTDHQPLPLFLWSLSVGAG